LDWRTDCRCPIEWLSDNGSPYTAREARALAREIGLVPYTTPIESPQSTDVIDKRIRERFRVASAVSLSG